MSRIARVLCYRTVNRRLTDTGGRLHEGVVERDPGIGLDQSGEVLGPTRVVRSRDRLAKTGHRAGR